jgi:hypothetical protein
MRTIVESERYKSEKARLGLTDPQLDEIMWYIDEALSRMPEEFGRPTDQPGIFAAPIPGDLAVPALVIYYAYTDTQVILASIRAADPRADGQDRL